MRNDTIYSIYSTNGSDTPLLNQIRGVSKKNPLGWDYHVASNSYFGTELHEFTGY